VLAGVLAGAAVGRGVAAGRLAGGVRDAALSWWLAGAAPQPASATVAAVTIQMARGIRRRA
jgi:hypothetical protein